MEATIKIAPLQFILVAILACLKISGIISWSWWIVTAPIWVTVILGSCFILIIGIIVFISYILNYD